MEVKNKRPECASGRNNRDRQKLHLVRLNTAGAMEMGRTPQLSYRTIMVGGKIT